MTPLVWHPSAKQELVDQAEKFAQIDSKLVTRFNGLVNHYLRVIQEIPHAFHERRFEIRRANLLPKFGDYYIAYLLWNERVVILALGHAKRRPYYFRDRFIEARRLSTG